MEEVEVEVVGGGGGGGGGGGRWRWWEVEEVEYTRGRINMAVETERRWFCLQPLQADQGCLSDPSVR